MPVSPRRACYLDRVSSLPFALTDAAGEPIEGYQLLDGPIDVGAEERWLLRLPEGELALLGRLSPALARDESLRRRWVRDVERLRELQVGSVSPILAAGPRPDPRNPDAEPPWRLRLEPEGERLSEWLTRAPVPIDELAQRIAALADALHAIHLAGAVVRRLHPRDLVWTREGRLVLTDIGLARVELLSSHTASSILVSGSAYTAPEQLMRTVIDQRADLYSLGVIAWHAATGSMPFGDGPALLRERVALPSLMSVRPDAPPILDLLLSRCLAELPEDRPDSAVEIAWVLRGGAGEGLMRVEQTVCQHCGAALRLGQRLCLSCGRLGVRFAHLTQDRKLSWGVELTTLAEDAQSLTNLREFVYSVARGPLRPDEFVIGDVSLYSDHELVWRKRLPARLFENLDEDTAKQLCARMRELSLDVRVIEPSHADRWSLAGAGIVIATIVATTLAAPLSGGVAAIIGVTGALISAFTLSRASSAIAERRIRPLYQLRDQPAALPASDPLVARIAALLEQTDAGPTPADVRAQLGELALLVQRLVDRRAELTGLGEAREVELLTGPVEPLIGQLEARVESLTALDRALAELDESAMVRALAALDARGVDPGKREVERGRLLTGLDRLRNLEDQRTAGFHGLLEAATLLRRAINLGLGVHDPVAEQQRQVQLALAALG